MSKDSDEPHGSCGYQGYEFGASYPDSICIDGELWDADSGDDDRLLTVGGDMPCPGCNTAAYLDWALEEAVEDACGQSMFTPWCAATAWEGRLANALRANADEVNEWLATLQPFEITDWPDRAAVYECRAGWDKTIRRLWTSEDLALLRALSAPSVTGEYPREWIEDADGARCTAFAALSEPQS
jgi:hypothetical protein